MSLPSFAVRRAVTTGVIFVAISVFGLVSFSRLSLDMFPDVEIPTITVVTVYPGASATDVDEMVTDVLEDHLAVSPGLTQVSSMSRENVSVVVLHYDWGADLDEASNDVRTRIELAARDLPAEAERPVMMRVNLAMLPVLMLGVTSEQGDVQESSATVERVISRRIERLEGVASVTAVNERRRQVVVEVDRQRLEDYGLSLETIAGVLQMENLSLPAGTIDLGRTSHTLRVPGELASLDEVRGVIVAGHRGSTVRLSDVAEVREELEETRAVATVDGRPALLLLIHKESGTNVVDVARRVTALVSELERDLPGHLRVVVLGDSSQFIVDMVGHLSSVVYLGGVIVIVVVFVFLRRLRTTAIVALTIPACLIAVFAMLWSGGYTINAVSLASMAISIGIVVDNSIVVLENIIRRRDRGEAPRLAAVRGAEEVQTAVFASSLTNVAIFAPIVFVGGLFGIFFKQLAFVIVVAVTLSLLVALMLAPMLASRLIGDQDTRRGGRLWAALGRPVELLEERYGALIAAVTRSRRGVAAVIAGALVVFAGSSAIALFLGQDYLPNPDGGTVTVRIELPSGTRTEHTAEVAGQVEAILRREVPEALLTYVQAGESRDGGGLGSGAGANVALVGARLPRLAERSRTVHQIIADLRPHVARVPGIASFDVGQGSAVGATPGFGGSALVVEVFAGDPEVARRVAIRIRDLMASLPGASDVSTDLLALSPELRVEVDRERASRLGVPMAKVASAVRLGVHGQAVTRFRGEDQDIELVVRLRPEDRASVETLGRLTVPSFSGAQVRLDNIARVEEARSPVEIRRLDGSRVVRVTAGVEGRALSEVAADVEAGLAALRGEGEVPDDVETRLAGAVEDQRSMAADLVVALALAILLVYLVMAAQFESLLDPLVIMFSVPFGVTGVFLALLVTGTTLQLTSFMGVVIIVGIVVNNAIVLVDYVNEMRRGGMEMRDAVVRGGARRLRPVLMTTLTTVAGMAPLAFASGEGSEIWRPMAIAVIGGLVFSMLVTLLLVPAVYVATERWRRSRERLEVEAGGG